MDSARRETAVELSVLVPCLNEEANLPELIERLDAAFRRGGISGEVILVDDGSNDGTWNVARALAGRYGSVIPLRHETNQGIVPAWRTALRAARGHLVCLIDADLQYQPEDVLRLLRMFRETHCDVVQGWRSPVARKKDSRYIWSRGLNWLLNRLFGMRLKDSKSGFVLCPREVLVDLLRYRRRYAYWQSLIMVAAHAKDYSYREVETLFEERRAGESFLSGFPLWVILRAFIDLIPAFLEYRIRPPRRDVTNTFLLERGAEESRTRPAADVKRIGRGARWHAYRRTFNATHWMMTSDALTHLAELEHTQWLRPEALRELQAMKLKRLIRHAYRNVPFYRERMQQLGVRPEDVRDINDLARLPLLTKQDVRENLYFDIMSENHNKAEILRVATSGSTGEPFVCYADRSQLEFRWAATMRSMMWTGWRPGEPQVRLWHQTIGMTPSQALRERVDGWLLRRTFIPAYEVSESTIDSFLRKIERSKAVLLDGYAESFNILARQLKEAPALDINPRGIISSAQQLPDATRKIIEAGFNCSVFDKYGSREFSGIAYECNAHSGHHVVGEGYIVEIMREGRSCAPGEIGEVVVTDLNNFCLPFIRYRIGDLAEAIDNSDACSCGRGLPLIGRIEGRLQSVIVGADGRYVPGTFFAHVFKDFDHAVKQYQVHQVTPGRITLRIVPGGRYSQAALDEILDLLRHFLGASTGIDLDIVDRIEMVRTGKIMQAVSTVAVDLQAPDAGERLHLPR